MRAFDELTARGKAWRLRHVAMAALAQYPLQPTGVSLVGMYTNTLFRVRTAEGTSYVVRVCAPGWRTDTTCVPRRSGWRAWTATPTSARRGHWRRRRRIPGACRADGLSCRCMVMGWVRQAPGAPPDTGQSGKDGGALCPAPRLRGGLPAAGRVHHPPHRPRAGPGEADVLFAPQTLAALSPADRERLTRLRDVVAEAFARRYDAAETAPPQVIHDDLWHDNIHLYRGGLYPLDFEDTCWGYPVQDLAMALQD